MRHKSFIPPPQEIIIVHVIQVIHSDGLWSLDYYVECLYIVDIYYKGVKTTLKHTQIK